MTDKDRGSKPQPNEILPSDEELEEAPGDFAEADQEFEEETPAAAATPAGARTSRTEAHRPLGSVREAHERVHIDDRLSAAFALICAVALVGVLVFPWLGGFVPKPAAPVLTPLVVPTYNATPTPVPTATVVPSASASPAS